MKKINFNSKTILPVVSYLLALILNGCAGTIPKEPSWAETTLQTLSLREKIAQMMVSYMNMRFKDISPQKWTEIISLIESDGIGTIHLWYGDAGSSMTMMNKMQSISKVPILFDADIE